MSANHLSFETFEGVQIVVADYRGCDADELLRRLRLVRDWVVLQPQNSVLIMTLAAGIRYRPDAMRELVAILRETKPYMRASAVVGLAHLTLLIRIVNHLSGRGIETFENIDDARRWLRAAADRTARS